VNALSEFSHNQGQIRLLPQASSCRPGASGSPPIPDSVAAAVPISSMCQVRTCAAYTWT